MLEENKHYLFESRLAPIVRQLGLGTINDLCALLQAIPGRRVGRQVVEAMTTNETYFFRDPAQYDAIRTVLLPRLIENGRQQRSCASGPPPHPPDRKRTAWQCYCLALGLGDWNVQILGTDFSSQVLERARSGKYQQIEVNRGLPAALLVKHFRQTGVDWQLSDAVRRMVSL